MEYSKKINCIVDRIQNQEMTVIELCEMARQITTDNKLKECFKWYLVMIDTTELLTTDAGKHAKGKPIKKNQQVYFL